MSRRIVTSVREAINGSATPSIQTRVRRPSPRSSPVMRSRAKMRSARANFPKPRATMRESDATRPSLAPRTDIRSMSTNRCSALRLVRGAHLAQPGVHARVGVVGGEVGLPDLGDDGVVGVADVGDGALGGLGDELVAVEGAETALAADPGDQVVLGDAEGVLE